MFDCIWKIYGYEHDPSHMKVSNEILNTNGKVPFSMNITIVTFLSDSCSSTFLWNLMIVDYYHIGYTVIPIWFKPSPTVTSISLNSQMLTRAQK